MKLEEAKDQKLGTRWDQAVKASGKPPKLPPIVEGRFLIEAFKDLGCASPTGMGEVPLTFGEVVAYGQASGGLTGQEILVLRKMSRAYCYGKFKGRDPGELPPWPEYDQMGEIIPEDDPDLEPWEKDDG